MHRINGILNDFSLHVNWTSNEQQWMSFGVASICAVLGAVSVRQVYLWWTLENFLHISHFVRRAVYLLQMHLNWLCALCFCCTAARQIELQVQFKNENAKSTATTIEQSKHGWLWLRVRWCIMHPREPRPAANAIMSATTFPCTYLWKRRFGSGWVRASQCVLCNGVNVDIKGNIWSLCLCS